MVNFRNNGILTVIMNDCMITHEVILDDILK